MQILPPAAGELATGQPLPGRPAEAAAGFAQTMAQFSEARTPPDGAPRDSAPRDAAGQAAPDALRPPSPALPPMLPTTAGLARGPAIPPAAGVDVRLTEIAERLTLMRDVGRGAETLAPGTDDALDAGDAAPSLPPLPEAALAYAAWPVQPVASGQTPPAAPGVAASFMNAVATGAAATDAAVRDAAPLDPASQLGAAAALSPAGPAQGGAQAAEDAISPLPAQPAELAALARQGAPGAPREGGLPLAGEGRGGESRSGESRGESISALLAATPGGPAAATPGAGQASASATLSAPLTSAAWPQQLAQQVSQHTLQLLQRGGEQRIELHLNPAELGPLSISLKVSEQAAQGQFLSAHAGVRGAVEQALPQLREALAEQGISLGNTSVGEQRQGDTQGDPAQRHGGGSHGEGLDEDAGNLTASVTLPAADISLDGRVDLYA